MNKVYLNTVSLAKEPAIYKGASAGGSGSGVTINNQQKSVDITENGVTEVTADSGFTGLSKVVVNTNVASSGGGGGSDMPVIGDGKTYLYINIAAEGRMDVPLYFSQSVANGVTIDWGDGSAPQTLSGTGNRSTTHKYATIGDYVISLDPADGCTLGLGHNTTGYCVMGSTADAQAVYRSMLRMVEIGKSVTSIGSSAFNSCASLTSIVIPDSVTSIGSNAFYRCSSLAGIVIPDSVTSIGSSAFNKCTSLTSIVIPEGVTSIDKDAFNGCTSLASIVIPDSVTSIGELAFYGCTSLTSIVIPDSVTSILKSAFNGCASLASIVIPDSVTSIGDYAFNNCSPLASVVIPEGVTSIGSNTFYGCKGMAFYDFSSHTSVPSLGSSAFSGISSDCKIIVPDALYDEWIAATNWSTYESKIIKKSDWDASQS